jgi:hypothetical protein
VTAGFLDRNYKLQITNYQLQMLVVRVGELDQRGQFGGGTAAIE